ncbi:hypothetical protein L1286_14775 [Pseudoalteromonas sp. SMS1]|uniref:hypothetical protein n=1 Tax=Pseudoalteromonas sp. SMS1 TaxID=2908894 RepID=UPI001F27AF93|nr:hypothetical protein [Pseudoalteromonas sp. SMS1]MCF2858749.1 hypothetical protein [Pseudoalteromonas sp. SMS1]
MKNIFILALLLLSVNCFALERRDYTEISIQDIIADTQAQPEGAADNHMTLVWWVPFEYWASIMSRDPNLTEQMKKQMLDVLKDYLVVGIVQADVSAMGVFNYYSQSYVEKNLKVNYKTPNSKGLNLTPSNKVSEEMTMLMTQVKPILQGAMGNMGLNFHFFIFDDSDNKGARVVDPHQEGNFVMSLKNKAGVELTADFKTPLNSLFVPRVCPNGEEAHVSWKYCPWSGKKL